ncbi:MAG TPA: twin-arginine translocase TatA/TatE family subunit [Planctomycetota bacterium]|nr:twin-arginine translocase TatA/TatE family subunit [Planctomycetota bacterium]
MPASALALLDGLGGSELFVLLVIGLVLFGRDLPDVGRKLGQTMAKLRRGMQEFKDQLEKDSNLQEVRKSMDEVKRAASFTSAVTNPGRLLTQLTNEALSSPPPAPAAPAPPPPAPVTDAPQNGAAPPTSSSAS